MVHLRVSQLRQPGSWCGGESRGTNRPHGLLVSPLQLLTGGESIRAIQKCRETTEGVDAYSKLVHHSALLCFGFDN